MTAQTLTNWEETTLGNISEYVSRGISPSYVKDNGIVVLNQKCVRNNIIVFSQSRLTSKDKQYSSEKFLKKFDVLVNSTGVGTLGRVAQNKSEKELLVDSHITIARPLGEKVDPQFFGYLLIYQESNIESLGKGATGQTELSKEDLKAIEVKIPRLKESQKQIVDIISTYDDLIANNTRRIQILEQMAQAIYTKWFSSPASNWKIMPLRDVIKSYIGGGWGKEELDKKYSGSAYVIRGTDIPKAAVGDVSTCPFRYHTPSNLKTRVLQDGDLVFEVSGGSKGQPVGRSLLVTSMFLNQFNQKVICASFCKLIRPDQDKISPFQLYEQMLSWYANGIIEKYQVQSTGISNFRFESFIDEEKVALPPQEVRDKFEHIVSPLFDEISLLGNRNQNLRQTRDLLLPKLVTGEIRV